MVKIIQDLIGNEYLATLIMSFVPLIELKGGIVFARGAEINFIFSLLLAYFGSTIVFIPIYFLLRPILNLFKKIGFIKKLAEKIETYFSDKANETLEKHKEKNKGGKVSEKLLKQLCVFIFVAIPLPMTGVWTGTAIAVFLNLKFKDTILPVAIGNLVAGLIISVLAQVRITLWNIAVLDYILYALFALAVLLLIVLIVKVLLKNPKREND
jgi:uncharacterized membrane protein